MFPRKEQQNLSAVWRKILSSQTSAWRHGPQFSRSGSRVLIATSTGGEGSFTSVESLLAAALTLRGAEVHGLICDQYLPACMLALRKHFPNLTEFVEYGPAKSL